MFVSYPRFHQTDRRDLKVPAFYEENKTSNFAILRFEKQHVKQCLNTFLICVKCPGVSKNEEVGLGSRGHVQKSRNHSNESVLISPLSKSKTYKTKNGPE